jgi:hypothetical protein
MRTKSALSGARRADVTGLGVRTGTKFRNEQLRSMIGIVTTIGMGQLNAHPPNRRSSRQRRQPRPKPHATWRLDEPYLKIDGRMSVNVPSFCFSHDFQVSFSSV